MVYAAPIPEVAVKKATLKAKATATLLCPTGAPELIE